jgi:hypothetical protein
MTDTANKIAIQEAAKKLRFFRRKFTIFFVILPLVLISGAMIYVQKRDEKAREIIARQEAEKFNSLEEEVFDLSSEKEAEESLQVEVEGSESAEFPESKSNESESLTYQFLVRQQEQILELRHEVTLLKDEISKARNQDKISKMIFAYLDLRQKFFAGEDYTQTLTEIDLLARADMALTQEIKNLKIILPRFVPAEKLRESFSSLVPQLISERDNQPKNGFTEKLKQNLSKLVIIRKINTEAARNDNDVENIDAKIAQIEKLLRERNYQKSYQLVLALPSKYQQILQQFMIDLQVAHEVAIADQAIINHLKSY